MEWDVVLTNNKTDLRELAQVWNTPEFTIKEDGSHSIF